jgi:hypothetical protein
MSAPYVKTSKNYANTGEAAKAIGQPGNEIRTGLPETREKPSPSDIPRRIVLFTFSSAVLWESGLPKKSKKD